MLKKKLIALLLCIMMIVTMIPSVVFAGATDELGLTSSNERVVVLDDSVAVYSNPIDYTYYISSDGLVSSLSSSTGYSIAYVDANKEAKTVKDVRDGYVVLTKSGAETVYIPVTARGQSLISQMNTAIDGTAIAPRIHAQNNHISYSSGVASMGGKTASDGSEVFVASDSNPNFKKALNSYWYYSLPSKNVYTFEINVYTEGDAGACINYHYDDVGINYEIVNIKSDGTVWCNVNGTLVNSGITSEKGKWHKIALTYDQPRHRFHVYFDGKMLTKDSKYLNDAHAATLWVGITPDSSNGKVAYDDIDVYGGFYQSNGFDAPQSVNDIKFDAETKTITYDEYEYSTPEALAEAIASLTDVADAEIYTDSSLSVVADSHNDLSNVCVFSSYPENVFNYYSLKALGDEAAIDMIGLKSTSPYVEILDDYIAVYSHPIDRDKYIGSQQLCNDGYLTSSAGYTFKYLAFEDYETTIATAVSGFIRATSPNGRIFDIPIKTMGKKFVNEIGLDYNDNSFAPQVYNSNITTAHKSGLGGKSSDDTAFAFVAGDAPANEVAKLSGFAYSALNPAVPYTFEFNVYIDGNAGAGFNFLYQEDSYRLLEYRPDGSIYYNLNGSLVAFDKKIETGKWHRFAVTFDSMRNRNIFYVDGELISDKSKVLNRTEAATIRLGISHYSANGTVAYDDLRAYSGYYYAGYSFADYASSDGAVIDNTNSLVRFDPVLFDTPANLANSISASESFEYAVIYTDSTLSQKATEFTDNCILVAKTSEYGIMKYYSISDFIMLKSEDNVTARILTPEPGDEYILAVASYLGNKLVSVDLKTVNAQMCEFPEIEYSDEYTYKAFLWNKNDFSPIYEEIDIPNFI